MGLSKLLLNQIQRCPNSLKSEVDIYDHIWWNNSVSVSQSTCSDQLHSNGSLMVEATWRKYSAILYFNSLFTYCGKYRENWLSLFSFQEPVFSPQSIICVRIFVTIGIQKRCNVPVNCLCINCVPTVCQLCVNCLCINTITTSAITITDTWMALASHVEVSLLAKVSTSFPNI